MLDFGIHRVLLWETIYETCLESKQNIQWEAPILILIFLKEHDKEA